MKCRFARDLVMAGILLVTCFGSSAAEGPEWDGPWIKEPYIVTRSEPEYPPLAKLANISVVVDVNIYLGADGVPVKTEILRRHPPMAYLFDDAVRRCVMGWRFSPAIGRGGTPFALWIAIPISLKIPDFTAPSCDSLASAAYPTDAAEMGLEGWVGLMVLVDELGHPSPDHIYVVDRPPHQSEVFDASARAAVLRSRFTPARLGTAAVNGWCFATVEFKIPTE